MLSLVQFIERTARKIATIEQITVVTLFVILAGRYAMTSVRSWQDVHALLCILLTQNVVTLTAAGSGAELHSTNASVFVSIFTGLTGILIAVAIIPDEWKKHPLPSRLVTVLLFMYSDAVSVVADALFKGTVAVACSLVACVVLTVVSPQALVQRSTLVNVARGLSMVAMSTIQRSLLSGDSDSNALSGAALLILFVMLLDTLQDVVPSLSETKEYAIWKAAALIHRMYVLMNVDSVAEVPLFVLVLVVLSWIPMRSNVSLELFVLLIANELIHKVDYVLQYAFGVDQVLLLFMSACAVKVLQHVWTE
jgi:hypothetical protein